MTEKSSLFMMLEMLEKYGLEKTAKRGCWIGLKIMEEWPVKTL